MDGATRPSGRVRLLVAGALAAALLAPVAFADTAASALREREATLAPKLQDNAFGQPLLGAPTLRRLGSWTLYFSRDATLRLCMDGGGDARWHEGRLAVVAPYRSHRLASAARDVCDVLIEPETIDASGLDDPLRAVLRSEGMLDTAQPVLGGLLERLCAAHDGLASQLDPLPADDAAFDTFVFGAALPKPQLDPRIITALETLKVDDNLDASAQELADRARLSFHRFLHLFSNEVGVPLRTFRSWKRARAWLKHVTEEASLTDFATQHRGDHPALEGFAAGGEHRRQTNGVRVQRGHDAAGTAAREFLGEHDLEEHIGRRAAVCLGKADAQRPQLGRRLIQRPRKAAGLVPAFTNGVISQATNSRSAARNCS
jgi:hypothetical protein